MLINDFVAAADVDDADDDDDEDEDDNDDLVWIWYVPPKRYPILIIVKSILISCQSASHHIYGRGHQSSDLQSIMGQGQTFHKAYK